ncbi:xanthine dehydrogenase accessory factor [Actinacidiphila yanglinensis]|uniref:Xanthine dehydrogenase accessory factor n=1 Tax=Actinacidiphila yanglinensis TaxID=310779 RepID=A0A1H6BS24_9ACTN|nr:XdhC/CoxI family protein [Actinacidiphila yanglinensis]SEG63432.1 xanthine dehydrogenase accessory factor [Actinacidiphila yanglinensis]
MRDIAEGIASWQAAGTRFAVATVVRTWKSAPRRPGASMAVAENGDALGSVSGGCVEGAVYELAREVISSGQPATTAYGVSDDDAFEVGLTCGGTIELLVRPAGGGHFPQLPAVLDAIAATRPVAVATLLDEHAAPSGDAPPALPGSPPERDLVVTPESAVGGLGDPGLDAAVTVQARGLLAQGATTVIRVGRSGEQRRDDLAVFVQSFAPPPRLLVFGAIDFAGAVARIGKFLGYHVTVCDARPVFATRKRFPDADELVVSWPHRFLDRVPIDENTVICVLTHDPKFDIPLLERALRSPARYIGAMGSRRTHEDRLRRLREAGVPESALARLASPIGLDLGARTPEETAVAIMAEVIALHWGGSGQRLIATTPQPIHH